MRISSYGALTNLIAAMLATAALAGGASARQTTAPDPNAALAMAAAPLPEDGPAYPVSRFDIRYVRDNPDQPPVEGILSLEVPLGWTRQGWVAPRADVSVVRVTIGDAAARGTENYHASAIQRILEAIRDHLNGQGLISVYVAPDPMQIAPPDAPPGTRPGQDLRPQDQSALTILITTGVVAEVRTLASGERVGDEPTDPIRKLFGIRPPIKPDDRINHPLHQRIRERSPIQPHREGDPDRRDLLNKEVLDRYLFHLSRHPGRRVDAAVAAAPEPGTVALDYMITENNPLVMYAQISNTGTRSTDYTRYRFGFLHSQLTNRDDILSFDFVTSFDDSNAVVASYEAPFENDRVRWRVHGNWSEFRADEVGFFDGDFTGESWALGGEIIANIYQRRELFVDLVGGLRFENIEVDNEPFLISGEEDFIVPHFGARLDQTTEWYSTQGWGIFEWWYSSADDEELAALGRTDPDENPLIFQWGISQAIYLEPVFDREAWEDPTTAEDSTLAHEVLASLRGQFAFGDRVIPQAEQTVGGLYTVRGYPESVVAGDDVVIGSVEYRYHLPRALKIEPEPRELFGEPFRVAPQYVFGRPDWDLVLKAFFDIGRANINDRLSFEENETLMGAGVGLDFLFKRNLNLRLDWGFALEDVDAGNVNSGSNRLHVVATLLF